VAIVTGGGSGIGRATALLLAREGARVVVADVADAATKETVDQVRAGGGEAVGVHVDVSEGADVARMVTQAVAVYGRLDILVNNAALTLPARVTETTDEVWASMIDLNLLGVVRCCRAAIPHLQRSTKSPAIVNISSVNALAALGSEPYSSAKAGIGALTINLAASLAADGIRVNTVAPATIRTRNWEGQEGGADRLRHLYPLGRVGEPEDVAAAVAFLASSDAAWITGHTLPVDGGLMTGARTT